MRRRVLVAFLITASIFSTVGCGENKDVEEISKKIPVEVTVVKSSDIKNETSYSGRVKGESEVSVFGKVPGTVQNVFFEIGEKVKEGDILASVDKTDVSLACETAAAGLSQAKTGLELVNGSSMQTAQINAKNAYESAKTNYENTKVLYENNVVAKTEFEAIERTYNQAKTAYELSVTTIPEENMKKAKDAVALAQAQYNTALQKLKDCDIKSPISGTVTAVNLVEGSMMSQSAPAFTIVNTDKINILVSVSEQLISSLKVGDDAKVYIKAVKPEPFIGKIIAVNAGTNQMGTYDIKIEIDNKDGIIKSGMFGEVSFTKEENTNTIVIPKDCVVTKDTEKYVYIAENGKTKQIKVETGIDTGEEIEILSGLKANDQVISKGQSYISDGDEIEIISPSKGE